VLCAGFFVFLFVPLVVVAVFAFNDAPYPTPPLMGFTLDWFVADNDLRTGSAARRRVAQHRHQHLVALATLLSVGGYCNAFGALRVPGKNAGVADDAAAGDSGVIPGMHFHPRLASRNNLAADEAWGLELEFPLVCRW
jgi:spermidine/putrescine transport system permease protein